MSEIVADLALALWRRAGGAAAPALRLFLALRGRAGKEDPARRGERLGLASRPRPAGPLVWVHAASVGEMLAAMGLVERLTAAGHSLLLTTGTVTSAAIAATRLPSGAIHQFVPLDVAGWIGRFLDHWRPTLAIFVESEIWPATVLALADRGVPQVLVNGRVSERSARRWRVFDGLPHRLFGRLALTLAQSPADADRLAALGADPVTVTGNLKFDGRPLVVDEAELAALTAVVGDRPTWVAASTHPGEEAIVAAAHRRLAAAHPDLLTVLAPRHPQRGDEVRAVLAEACLAVASRSKGELPRPGIDVYLCDTIGEMGLVYRLAPVAFVGGSLVVHGGQNPIEPARLGVAVLHGPHVANFRDLYRDLDDAGAARGLAGPDDLAAALAEGFADPTVFATAAAKAHGVLDGATGALDRTLAALAPLLPSVTEGAVRCAV